MMIKIAVVFCAVLATSMVFASDVDEQALGDLLELMLSEEATPEDKVYVQGFLKNAFSKVKNGVSKVAGLASGACTSLGYSPEEARAKILAAYPEMKDQMSEELIGGICKGAHALHGLTG